MDNILKYQNPSSPLLIQRVNQSGANFVKRLLDPNRKSIPDWETKGQKIATHKMSWGEDDHGAYVFPEVQEIDGQLIDFSRPPYAPGMADYMAHKNNNIVRMSPEEADWFTRNYKQYYPSFKKGGRIHIKKKNRGKFTEYCGGKVTEECIARGKNSKDPKIRKRATFAANARKWKHENGGIIRFQPGGTVKLDDYGYPADITPAIVTQDSEFNKFLMTLPDNLRLTPEKDYHMYDYWKLSGKPEDFKEGERRGMFTWDNSDKGYHAGSIAEDRNTGIYHFMKPKHHPTVKYELDWFNKGLQTLEGGKQVPVEGKDKEFWEDFKSKYQLDTTGIDYRYVPIQKKGGPLGRPNFKESREAYYDPETDTVFAPDSLGEFYHHEMFHARPNLQLLESLKPYYHNLNDDVLKQIGADLSFVKRFNNDPGYFYSPEELGARVVSASEMLNRMGVKDVTLDFLKNTRLNENAYGDNFRDLLHMYNDENLIKIFNSVRKHENGGTLKAQEGTPKYGLPGGVPTYMQTQPFSPIDIAIKTAQVQTSPTTLPPGVKEVVGPDGKKIVIRTEQPLQPMGQEVAAWLPGVGDVVEVGQIVNDVKNGNLGTAALAAGLMVLPGNARKILDKFGVDLGDISTFKRLSDQEWDDMYFQAIDSGDMDLVQTIRDAHFKVKAAGASVDADGNLIKTYRGQYPKQKYKEHDLNPFSDKRDDNRSSGYFSSTSSQIADTYVQPGGDKFELYTNFTNPSVVDAKGKGYKTAVSQVEPDGRVVGIQTDAYVNKAFGQGYDGVIIKNVKDASVGNNLNDLEKIADDYVGAAGRSKLADPITRELDIFTGDYEIIPISRRDNFNMSDIRYGIVPLFLGLGAAKAVSNSGNTKEQQ